MEINALENTWTTVPMPPATESIGSVALLGFPGLEIGVDSHTYIDPSSLEQTLLQLRQNNCRRFYNFAHEEDLPDDAHELVKTAAKAMDIEFIVLAIKDFGTPSQAVALAWQEQIPKIISALSRGELVALGCLSGIGRSGMMSANLLTHQGLSPQAAIDWVRQYLPEAIENPEQERWVSFPN